MENPNLEIMRHFPAPEDLPSEYESTQAALRAAWFVVAAARAAVDEITERTPQLTDIERFTTDAVAENLAVNASDLHDIIDK